MFIILILGFYDINSLTKRSSPNFCLIFVFCLMRYIHTFVVDITFYWALVPLFPGTYIDKKCPFTGDVSIRGRILAGTCHSAKMMRTIIVRRNYLHWVKKYQRYDALIDEVAIMVLVLSDCFMLIFRYEKRHSNIPAHISPCFRVKEGDHVIIGQCRLVPNLHYWLLLLGPPEFTSDGLLYRLAGLCQKPSGLMFLRWFQLVPLVVGRRLLQGCELGNLSLLLSVKQVLEGWVLDFYCFSWNYYHWLCFDTLNFGILEYVLFIIFFLIFLKFSLNFLFFQEFNDAVFTMSNML